MLTLLLTFAVMSIIISGMAVGVIIRNKPIKGSCGGLAALGMKSDCEICGSQSGVCEKEDLRESEADACGSLGYDATK